VQGEPEFHAYAGVLQVDVEEFADPCQTVAHGVAVDVQGRGGAVPAAVQGQPGPQATTTKASPSTSTNSSASSPTSALTPR
jgi:hypothetical protein